MPRLLLILALSTTLLCSLATARPLAEVSRTTTPETSTSFTANKSPPSQPPPPPEHSGPGPTTPVANPPTSAAAASGKVPEDEPASAASPEAASQGKHRKHRSADKSIAGGEVILGGLVTAIFAAVICYIRVTRKKSLEEDEQEPVKV